MQTWEESEADAIDVKADSCEAAIHSLDRIQGIFKDSREMRSHISAMCDLLSAEVDNMHRRAESLRSGVDERAR